MTGNFLHAGTFSTPPCCSHAEASVQFQQPSLVLEAGADLEDMISRAEVMADEWPTPTAMPLGQLPLPTRHGRLCDPASYSAHTNGNAYIHALPGGFLYFQSYGGRSGSRGLGSCIITSHL